ncbi:hypothetical protein [Alicyclobacillus vulcanalis]|uniref:Uncharacterized protein n=1 Tax=Alicyclobacillus vulcanalis TaxID=252246 RepID=A0A1N7LZY0_9BACL|nr:hypothetical protein [Alicyclobacillus vulcanalis]SIS79329.1 hypothetical protein SAMN05421799_104110 [Alicyclobacillus vulcanalis]
MKLDSFIKFGGLAFDIAQDEKVRTFVTMLHHGIKRRGLIPPATPQMGHVPLHPYHPAHWPAHHHAIPFSPHATQVHSAPQAAVPAPSAGAQTPAPPTGGSVKSEPSGTIGSGGGPGWFQQLLELFDRR